MITATFRFRLTALLGLLGVVLGALGAHGHVHTAVEGQGYLAQWGTAVQYHQIHSLLLLLLAWMSSQSVSPALKKWLTASFVLITLGILFFSGSLYVLSYTGIRWLGAITPLGGLCLMTGWLFLVFAKLDR